MMFDDMLLDEGRGRISLGPVVDPYEVPALAPVSSGGGWMPIQVSEAPSPVVSDPANWEYAASQNEPTNDPAWQESKQPVYNDNWPVEPQYIPPSSPTLVFNPETQEVALPIELYPVDYHYPEPIVSPPYNPTPVYEVQPMNKAPLDACNCITYPCECDGVKVYSDEPVRGIDQMPVTPTSLPVGTTVTEPPPIITALPTVTPTVAPAADDETALIFGFPWYYVVGAAAGALFLMSSMDGKK